MSSSCSRSRMSHVDVTERFWLSLSTQDFYFQSSPAPAGLDLVLGTLLSTGEV